MMSDEDLYRERRGKSSTFELRKPQVLQSMEFNGQGGNLVIVEDNDNLINNSNRNMFDQPQNQDGRRTEDIRQTASYRGDNLTASVVSDMIPETETFRD